MPKMGIEEEQIYKYGNGVAPYDTPEGRATAPQWLRDQFAQAAARQPASAARSSSVTARRPAGNQALTVADLGVGVVVGGIGLLLWVIALFLNTVKVDGMSASYVNGVCQSGIGQLGQAVSGAFGYSSPAQWCSQASTVETWKAILFWGGLALLCFAASAIGRKMGWIKPNRRQLQRQILENQLAAQRRAMQGDQGQR
jgi:hypothetical protein